MNSASPIRDPEHIKLLKDFYRYKHPNFRNYVMIVIGLNTALRISDILPLTWDDVYDVNLGIYRKHICLREKKTGKKQVILINAHILAALKEYEQILSEQSTPIYPEKYIISHTNRNEPISRIQAHRILQLATDESKIPHKISCHSLRKTFGYHAWKKGTPPALLMKIYNLSSFEITKRYLGIDQDDKDDLFENILL